MVLHPFVSCTSLFRPLGSLLCSPCIRCGLPMHLSLPFAIRSLCFYLPDHSPLFPLYSNIYCLVRSGGYTKLWMLLPTPWVPLVVAVSSPKHFLVCNNVHPGASLLPLALTFLLRSQCICYMSPTTSPLHVAFPVYFQVCSSMRDSVLTPFGLPVASLPMLPGHKLSVPSLFAPTLQLAFPRVCFVVPYITTITITINKNLVHYEYPVTWWFLSFLHFCQSGDGESRSFLCSSNFCAIFHWKFATPCAWNWH